VAAWCTNPDLIPDEKIMAAPEPDEEHGGGPPLYLRPHDIIYDEVPALRYWVRLRIIEFQDWHTPPTSNVEGYGYGDGDSGNSDSNFNGYWPSFCDCGGGGAWPRSTRFGGDDDPRLGRGSGLSFRPREASRWPARSSRRASPCCVGEVTSSEGASLQISTARIPAVGGTRVAVDS